jgi:mannosyl-3-phosphoglycerate phosphatase
MFFDSSERMKPPEIEEAPKFVLFTDLDGTAMDKKTHSFDTVQPVMHEAVEREIAITFVTSKTAAEILHLQERAGLLGKMPFVVENGHGIYIPKNHFSFSLYEALPGKTIREQGDFYVIEADMNFANACAALDKASKSTRIPILKQSDMTKEAFMGKTGLSDEDAERALRREYQEGFTILLPDDEKKAVREKLREALRNEGYDLTAGGLFEWIMRSGVTKGTAVATLTGLYRNEFPSVITTGIGDAPNDVSFLRSCDRKFLVANPDKIIDVPPEEGIVQLPEVGPLGWNRIVEALLHEHEK